MAEQEPNDKSGHPRRRTLTPEQRRFLNTPKKPQPNEPSAAANEEAAAPPPQKEERRRPLPQPPIELEEDPAEPEDLPERRDAPLRQSNVTAQTDAARTVEMRSVFLIFSAVILLGAVFVIGKKFDSIRYHLLTYVKGPDLDAPTNKYPGLSAEELVETGLAAERRGDWNDAAARFIEAKRKNRALPGILFRIGKSAYDRGDMASADLAFDRALKFGENIPLANYYRGLIAVRRHDLPAATRFFEAAAAAEPFVPDFYYFWGEALRIDQHPREAIHRYQQAMERASNPQDSVLYQFKIRLARIEAVETTQIQAEIGAARAAGPLSVDWLMTDAALQLQAGNIDQAARLISEARELPAKALFMTCAGDTVFRQAGEKHPEIRTATSLVAAPIKDAAPTPMATP